MKRSERLCASFSAVAALRRSHDDADTDPSAHLRNAIIVGDYEYSRDARNSLSRFNASLDKRLCNTALSLQAHHRFSREAR